MARKAELIEQCKDNGIEAPAGATIAELKTLLEAGRPEIESVPPESSPPAPTRSTPQIKNLARRRVWRMSRTNE